MLKQNEWYFLNTPDEFRGKGIIGSLNKIVRTTDNPNYVDIESWWITEDRKFIHKGIFEHSDSVLFSKYGKKVNPPPKVFEVLYSESVKEKITVDQTLDTEDDYND